MMPWWIVALFVLLCLVAAYTIIEVARCVFQNIHEPDEIDWSYMAQDTRRRRRLAQKQIDEIRRRTKGHHTDPHTNHHDHYHRTLAHAIVDDYESRTHNSDTGVNDWSSGLSSCSSSSSDSSGSFGGSD